MSATATDWNPEAYARFRGLRLRPAVDLLAQVGELPEGDIIDLGCGDGAVAPLLRARLPGRRLIGVDASPAMLEKASGYEARIEADVAGWLPERPPALIFSNAALHWLGDHAGLLPRLARALAPGGVLAVQMPRQFFAPSHRFLRDIAQTMFPDRFDFAHYQPPVAAPVDYALMLGGLGQLDVWETDYIQRLAPDGTGHPVRAFTAATAMRPIAARLDKGELDAFTRAYDRALAAAYPLAADGAVLMPFRRLFFVLKV